MRRADGWCWRSTANWFIPSGPKDRRLTDLSYFWTLAPATTKLGLGPNDFENSRRKKGKWNRTQKHTYRAASIKATGKGYAPGTQSKIKSRVWSFRIEFIFLSWIEMLFNVYFEFRVNVISERCWNWCFLFLRYFAGLRSSAKKSKVDSACSLFLFRCVIKSVFRGRRIKMNCYYRSILDRYRN